MDAPIGPATDQARRGSGPTSGADPAPLRCLIVDDNAHFLTVARALLEREGVAVVGVASTAAAALRRTEELRPDVTLVDIGLGGESGFELARRLQRRAGPAPPRVVLISIHAQEDYADLIAASPAAGFLTKTALSARAIRDLLRERGGGHRVSGPRER